MIKIGFTMIHYPVAMGRYILEALMRRDDVELWVAGPYSGRSIPWRGGMTLPEKYLLPPDYPLPMGNPPRVVYSILEKQKPFSPDLWIEVNAGLQSLDKPTSAPFAVVGTDPHVLNYDEPRRKADKFFCMQKPYMKEGDVWLPYAHSPEHHSPTTVKWEERGYDITLIGLQYRERIDFFNRVQALGLSFFFDNGFAYDDARGVYHNTRVGFNLSSLKDTTARVFELMGFGILPLLNRVPDLMELFTEDEHFLGFDTLDEAISKLQWALSNPEQAKRIAYNAHNAVLEEHTWDARAETILREMGVLDG